jgi:hypothetical protein
LLHHSTSRGAALIDVIAACAVMAIVAAMAIPAVHATRERGEARMAARYLAQRMQMLRVQAVRRNRMVALRFDSVDVGRFQAYVDGDGDGVLQRDIDQGVDTSIETSARLTDYFANVTLRVAAAVPAPDGAGWIPAGTDPVRIGGTSLLSFSPLGTATSGSIYLASNGGLQFCVRVLGSTGRVRVMWFDVASGSWRQD